MYKNQPAYYIRVVMKGINFSIILLLSGITCAVTYSVSNSFLARRFLEVAERLPAEPWKAPVVSVLCFILLLTIMGTKGKDLYKESRFLLFGTVELVLSLLIISALEFNDNSLILLVTADLLGYWKNTKTRIFFCTVLFAVFILTSFEVVSSMIPVISIKTYLYYYDESMRALIIAIKSMLSAGNILLFMFYMVLLIRAQFLEKERMSSLNKRLDFANSQLREANSQLEIYAEQSEKNAQMRERNRFAREIHDTLGHMLTGIIAGVDACITLAERSPQETKKQLKVIGSIARKGIKDVRHSMEALRPDALTYSDLEMALRQLVEDMEAITKTKIQFGNKISVLHFLQDEEDVIYRIVQESITNAIQHGQASQIRITLKKQDEKLVIAIEDNGTGCKKPVEGFGLRHMRERVELLGGTLAYQSGRGFLLTATIPVRWREQS